jgi:hypothetical protein
MLDEQLRDWFRPRPGRCVTCARHLVAIDENDMVDCGCEMEEGEQTGWTPGMHLDHCAFPSAPGEPGCASWLQTRAPQEEEIGRASCRERVS